MVRLRSLVLSLLVALATIAALIAIQNAALARFFPHLVRLTSDFSAAYLQRELQFLARQPGQTVVLGDSVLWGYRLQPNQSAVEILNARGCACRNLSFKISSPPNYFALALLMKAYHVHPAAVVLEINQRVLNPANDAYRALRPAVGELAEPLLSASDRALLAPRLHQWTRISFKRRVPAAHSA